MDFSNLRYWLLFAGGVAAFLAVAGCFRLFRRTVPGSVHKTFLVLIGLAALGYAGVETLLAFLFVCSVAYSSGAIVRRQEAPRARRITLACAIPILFLPLVWFKYRLFIADNLGIDIAAAVPLVLPVGISFYTFQAVGFLVDSARNRTEFPSLLDFLCFESFVPQIVAGPIERRSGLLPQMRSFRFRWRTADVAWGLRYVVLGLFFKLCLGDNLALCHPADPRGNVFALWLRNVSFGLRIYFDFCGYGLSAYGLARCMGVRLTQNFAAPYAAGNITDFWRRWHRSLTNWFRDYIYFPLGGGRTRLWAANLLAVFLLSGLWHGASWNFTSSSGAARTASPSSRTSSSRAGSGFASPHPSRPGQPERLRSRRLCPCGNLPCFHTTWRPLPECKHLATRRSLARLRPVRESRVPQHLPCPSRRWNRCSPLRRLANTQLHPPRPPRWHQIPPPRHDAPSRLALPPRQRRLDRPSSGDQWMLGLGNRSPGFASDRHVAAAPFLPLANPSHFSPQLRVFFQTAL